MTVYISRSKDDEFQFGINASQHISPQALPRNWEDFEGTYTLFCQFQLASITIDHQIGPTP